MRRWILAAVGAGLALRLALALGFPEYVSGDAFWYLRVGGVIADQGLFGPDAEKFTRPPVYPSFLGALLALFGDDVRVPARVLQCLLTSAGIWFLADFSRSLLPARPAVAVAVAWLHALDPWAADFAKSLYSENLTHPFFFVFLAGIGRALGGVRTSHVVWIAVAGGMTVLARVDTVATVVPAVLAAAFVRWRGGAGRAELVRWGAAAAGVVLVCLPWSGLATARLGRPTFVASTDVSGTVERNHGWIRWCGTQMLPRRQWLGILWWQSPRCDPAWLPDSMFDTPDEKVRVLAAMEKARAAGHPLPESEEVFAAVARERVERDPVRHWILNPLRRSAHIWLDPFDTDRPDAIAHRGRSLLGRAFDAATFVWVVIGGVGFLAAFVAVLRPGEPPFLPAVLVLARTYSLLFVGLVVGGHGLFERRYMTPVEPLAQGLAVWAVLAVADRLRRRTSGAAAGP